MILRAGPGHAAAMAAIQARVFATEGEARDPAMSWGRPWGEAAFALQLALPGMLGLIAWGEEMRGAGGLLLARLYAPESEVLSLGVVPEWRRRGIGRALIEAAMAEAMAAGVVRMVLEVAAGNAPARALYRQAGFGQVGRRRAYYADGTDALVLERELRSGP